MRPIIRPLTGRGSNPGAVAGGPLITTGRPTSSRWPTVRQRVMEWVARTTNSSSVGTAWMIAFPASDAVTTYLPNPLNDAVLTDFACPASSTASGAAPERSQTRAAESADAVTTRLPSALNDAPSTASVWPVSGSPTGLPILTSHSCAVLSDDEVTTSLPSAPNDAVLTGPLCPLSSIATGATGTGPDRSQIPAVLSHDAVTTRLPSALNDALRTRLVWPIRVRISR